MREIDDYDLIELDYEEFIRRGLEELRWEQENLEGPYPARADSVAS